MRMVVASFEREGPFREAARAAVAAGWRVVGCWSPYPVEGIGASRGPRGVVATVVVSGLGMAAALYALQAWSATRAYPLDLGSRPLNSWQTFLIAPIEFGALAAAIGGLLALMVRARLTRLNDPAFDLAELSDASRDRFVIALGCDDGRAPVEAQRLLAGAATVREVAP